MREPLQKRIPEQWLKILYCLAQGMAQVEIAREIGVSKRVMDHTVAAIKQEFYATTRTHLIAIVISLGIIDPSTIIPEGGPIEGPELQRQATRYAIARHVLRRSKGGKHVRRWLDARRRTNARPRRVA